jgi:putative DNA primase/helicase
MLARAEAPVRPLRSGSYLSAVTVLAQDMGGVLGGRQLAMNEMTARPELGGRTLDDVEIGRLRAAIESALDGAPPRDDEGRPPGLRFSKDDLWAAAYQVAADNPYHPVREYLEGVGQSHGGRGVTTEGIAAEFLAQVLGAEPSELNRQILRRWLISAVARAFEPGCKCDTVLVLIGPQGIGKSTFFATLADPWFVDTPMEVGSKDSYMVMRRGWLIEWAELESLFRARDSSAVKAFLSSRIDTYRPPYGRADVEVPRSSVIVGTLNEGADGFLGDETGNRRFWPLRVTKMNVAKLREWRDILWGEAVTHYRRGERWWFEPAEAAELGLAQVHEEHAASDPWEPCVLPYARNNSADGVTVASILECALQKPAGQWTKGDEMRLGRLLRRAGFVRRRSHGVTRWFLPSS